MIKNSSHKLFNQYGLHDFRRFNITRQVLHVHDFFTVARLHGQASTDTAKRYYQWGAEVLHIEGERQFKPIKWRKKKAR